MANPDSKCKQKRLIGVHVFYCFSDSISCLILGKRLGSREIWSESGFGVTKKYPSLIIFWATFNTFFRSLLGNPLGTFSNEVCFPPMYPSLSSFLRIVCRMTSSLIIHVERPCNHVFLCSLACILWFI